MDASMDRPKLRPIEATPVRSNGRDLITLYDPQGISEKFLSVSVAAAPILQLMDGRHTVEQIQQKVAQLTATSIPLEELRQFVTQLDERLLLESPRFQKFYANLLKKYREQPIREAVHAGPSYPAKAADIRRAFKKHFEPPDGPGADGASSGANPLALIIPHIDLRVGGPSYAWAYSQLRGTPAIDTFVILGVAHSGATNRFAGTKKNFETPLGVMPTDGAFADRLASKLPFDFYEDELAHRNEHSIEFQVAYLQYMLGADHQAQIVPILAGSFHDLMEANKEPIRDKQVAAFAKALRETIAESGRRVCLVASVDLAHVGGKFGDDFTVNEAVRKQLAIDDRDMLAEIEKADACAFYRYIHDEQDRRRVDAWPAVYTMLHTIDAKKAKLLHYAQHYERETNSVVTFASLRVD